MQNKPNLLKAQINANSLVIKDYENRWQRPVRKNKANQSQFAYLNFPQLATEGTDDRKQMTDDRKQMTENR